MEVDYKEAAFKYAMSTDQDAPKPVHHPVIVVGAGPVGLSVAIDLAGQGIKTLLLDDDDKLSAGSRAICFAKRTLEIWDRLGCGDRMIEKGVAWNVGKVFFRDELIYTFNLLPENGHRRPAFINLQQYYVEAFLLERAQNLANLEIRWKNRVKDLVREPACVSLTVETPRGPYKLTCDYLVAADGSRSTVRELLHPASKGQTFRDRFLIADIKAKTNFPAERWFWFDPPFHPGQSVLLHRQPDNIWRIDFQLGWEANPTSELKPERIVSQIKAMLGEDAEFDLEWCSVYTFACNRIEKFRHGRVLFAGDSAHGVSPFGARGANSGVQDAENLAWKLKLVLEGKAPDRLLDTYASEREYAADENIINSTRSTDFITPKSDASRVFRDAVLSLARHCAFARRFVNSGRLSVPTILRNSPLNTPDSNSFAGLMSPGAPAADAPIVFDGNPDWFLSKTGSRFTCVVFTDGSKLSAARVREIERLHGAQMQVAPIVVAPKGATITQNSKFRTIEDAEGILAKRFDALPGTVYLMRPDQHVVARWRQFNLDAVKRAVARATCNI